MDIPAKTETRHYQVLTEIPATIFRAYDIRGIMDETLSADNVYTIGLALGAEALSRGETHIAVARDGRLSSPTLASALRYGLTHAGMNVIDLNEIPTPLLYWFIHTSDTYQSGVMVTGSHNPGHYNGLKMVLGRKTLSGDDVSALRERILDGNLTKHNTLPDYQTIDVTAGYIEAVQKSVKIARTLKIVIDCGNGVPGMIAPQLFRALGCEVLELFCDVDGTFPNHHPDPSRAENLLDLKKAVHEQNADVGLAFDGDGDRLGVVTPQGKMIWPDRQLMLFAQDIVERNPRAQIIYDVKCSKNLGEVIRAAGGVPIMWKTGHSYIKNKMLETGALLAGEMSGHIFFKERWYGFDDAMYAGARLLEILSRDTRGLDVIFAELPDSIATPELLLTIGDERKFIFMDELIKTARFANAEICTIDGIRADYADGWGLVRASNTTPALVFRFEADDAKAMQRIQHEFAEWIHRLGPELTLPF
ncbi:MAG: phosphomannomutase/phosphoglucomutase [Pseudomonadota bacterium]|nr:phosphomannomutase/phosphoglucomutase [Pseudomonadota bacterium]